MVMSLIESLTRIKNAVYGREVREAIHDGVFRANQIADGADAKADKTQIRQDAVEDFNTQVIQEMTDKDVISAPEIIIARNGEDTLGKRLDKMDRLLDRSLVNVELFGVLGDGITDNTIALQSLLDQGGMFYFPNGRYRFSYLQIKKSNTEIYFGNDVTLLSDLDTDIQFSAAIETRGEVLSTHSVREDTVENGQTITLDSVDGLEVDDFIHLTQKQETGVTNPHERYLNHSLRIMKIDASTNTITPYSSIPNAFQVANGAVVQKVKRIENVIIQGNNTKYDKLGTTTYDQFFWLSDTHNLKIDGFECYNGGGHALTVSRSTHFSISNITHLKPTNVGAGHGYAVQVTEGCMFGSIRRVTSYDSRRGVDMSKSSSYISIDDCVLYNSSLGAHGMNSKYIYYNNCRLYGEMAKISMGVNSFSKDSYLVFNNCIVENALEAFAMHNGSHNIYLNNLQIRSSRLAMNMQADTHHLYIKDGIIENCIQGPRLYGSDVHTNNLKINESFTYPLRVIDGKNQTHKNMSIISSDLELSLVSLANVDNISFTNSVFDGKKTGGIGQMISLNNTTTDLRMDGCTLTSNMTDTIYVSNLTASSLPKDRVVLTNCEFINTGSGKALNIGYGRGFTKVDNNFIKGNTSLGLNDEGLVFTLNHISGGTIHIDNVSNTMIINNILKTSSFSKIPTTGSNGVVVLNNIVM